jgi:hypothetical protein
MSFFTTGADGKLKYTVGANDLLTPGYYNAEIDIIYATGLRTTRTFTLHIMESL